MARNWTVCGVCDSLEITMPSVIWCSECDEGLCTECDKHHAVSKASRTHSTIPIVEYKQLPLDILKIAHTCSKHTEKFQTYCKKHDCPCCHRCVIETHNGCIDITAIDDIIKGVKSSNAMYDIEIMLVEVAKKIENITKDRKDNLTCLKDQRRRIENEIQQTRIKINSHLDEIQEELMTKLNALEVNERKKIEDFLTTLDKKNKEICEYTTTLSNIKQHASELQTFLAIKQIEKSVSNEERDLETLSSSESLKQIGLSLKFDEAFKKIANIESIGQIEVEMRTSKLQNKGIMTRMKGKQAQLNVANASPILIKNIKLNLKRTIKTGLDNTRGCLLLPDGRLAFSCRNDNRVRLFKSDGYQEFEININSCNVFDITFIQEDNNVAVTSGGKGVRTISIIDMRNRKVSKQIRVNFSYYGIVYIDSKLITCAEFKGLNILKKGSSEVIDEIKRKDMSSCSYIAAFENKLYYTNNDHHTVTCCDMKGTDFWTFKDTSVLTDPRGITVDNDGNVYVAVYHSHQVFVISSDGKRFLELLNENDGLRFPHVLFFDRSTNQLLVANERDTALLFQVASQS